MRFRLFRKSDWWSSRTISNTCGRHGNKLLEYAAGQGNRNWGTLSCSRFSSTSLAYRWHWVVYQRKLWWELRIQYPKLPGVKIIRASIRKGPNIRQLVPSSSWNFCRPFFWTSPLLESHHFPLPPLYRSGIRNDTCIVGSITIFYIQYTACYLQTISTLQVSVPQLSFLSISTITFPCPLPFHSLGPVSCLHYYPGTFVT